MKKVKFFIGALAIVAVLGLDVQHAADGYMNNVLLAQGTSSGGYSGGTGTKKIEKVLTSQKLVITKITGQAAFKANLSVEDILDSGASAEIKGSVEANLKNCYQITCFEDGNCACVTVSKWTVCSTEGCPKGCK